MCGILGAVVNKDREQVIKTLYDLFLNQKTRGTDGAGISVNNGGELFRFRSLSPFRLFAVYNYWVWQNVAKNSLVMVHHRYPTSSENKVVFNHPIANEDDTVHLIHNGVLVNDKELFKKQKKNHTFETLKKDKFTDSEVIVHLFEDELKKANGDIAKALKGVYKETEGSFSIALNIKGETGVYLMKHSMPVIISKDDNGNYYFSSQLSAKSYLSKITELAEGEIGILKEDGYTKLSKCKEKTRKYKTVFYESNEDSNKDEVHLNAKGYWVNTGQTKWN